jgi:hypothetical protein
LAELLKETGIMEGSPPASPQYSTHHTADMSGDPLASISTIDLNDPSNLLSAGASISNGAQMAGLGGFPQGTTIQPTHASGLSQQTVLMSAGGGNGSGGPYYITPMNQSAPTTQLKLAFAPDGSVILQPVTSYGQTASGLTGALNATSQGIKIGDSITLRDTSGASSSQPSPDSTTPTLDAILPGASHNGATSISLSTPTISFSTSSLGTPAGKFMEGSAIKLTDSISLTIQNSTGPMDDHRQYQQNSTTLIPVGVKSETKKGKAKKETKKTPRKGSAAAAAAAAAAANQQLITIPIQTNLGSTTITPVMSNTNVSQPAVIQIGESSSLKSTLNGQMKKNEPTSNMLLLSSNSSLLGGNDSNSTTVNSMNNSSETPVVQISLNNQELYERLETQIKSLSQLKTPTAQQRNLLQELVELQRTMQSAKQQSGEGQSIDTNFILTSQPLLPQSTGTMQSKPEITIQSKPLTSNTQLLTPLKSKESSNTQIITITSKPLESSTNCKADQGCASIKTEVGITSNSSSDHSNESNNFKLLSGNCSNTQLSGSSQGTTIQVGNQIITITTPSTPVANNVSSTKVN